MQSLEWSDRVIFHRLCLTFNLKDCSANCTKAWSREESVPSSPPLPGTNWSSQGPPIRVFTESSPTWPQLSDRVGSHRLVFASNVEALEDEASGRIGNHSLQSKGLHSGMQTVCCFHTGCSKSSLSRTSNSAGKKDNQGGFAANHE